MTAYTVQCQYATHVEATVSVDADTLEAACQAAIDIADAGELWKSSDYVGDPHITAICEGANGAPWAFDTSPLPIPDNYAKDPPPLLTIDPTQDPPTLELTRGTIRFRSVTPAATVTTDITAKAPQTPSRPLIVIRPRPDGKPDVTVASGEADIRFEDLN